MIEYNVKVYENGTKEWYLNGKLHREDGPAIEYNDGNKDWYLNGKRHRVDGPAIEYADGYKAWFLNGVRLTEEEWKAKVNHSKTIMIQGKEFSEDTIRMALKNYLK